MKINIFLSDRDIKTGERIMLLALNGHQGDQNLEGKVFCYAGGGYFFTTCNPFDDLLYFRKGFSYTSACV